MICGMPSRRGWRAGVGSRQILLAWVNSGGFAATHSANPRAVDEAIVDDLLRFLKEAGWSLKKGSTMAKKGKSGKGCKK